MRLTDTGQRPHLHLCDGIVKTHNVTARTWGRKHQSQKGFRASNTRNVPARERRFETQRSDTAPSTTLRANRGSGSASTFWPVAKQFAVSKKASRMSRH